MRSPRTARWFPLPCHRRDARRCDANTADSAAAAAVDMRAITKAPAVSAEVSGGSAEITGDVRSDDFDTSGSRRAVSVPKGASG
jgi:hypothetical protein